MNKATIKSVNRAVAKAGIPLELVRGEGYHYWVYDNGSRFETVSEYTMYTSHLSEWEWMESAKEAYATITKYEVAA